MKKLIVLGMAVLLAACGETPTQPALDIDVAPQMAAGGADVNKNSWDVDSCYTWWGGEYCYAYKGMVHWVDTPSGNTNYFYKEDGSWSDNSWYYSYFSAGEYDYDYSFHIKKGQDHVYDWSTSQNWTYTSYGTTYNCTYEVRYHFANGKVTKNVYNYECVAA